MNNDNEEIPRHVITLEKWDGDGALAGCFLVSLLLPGLRESIDGRIFGSKDDALDYASGMMSTHPDAIFHDKSDDEE